MLTTEYHDPAAKAGPTREHIQLHRRLCRLWEDTELYAGIDEANYLLELADVEADDYPEHVTAASRHDALARIAAYTEELNWRQHRGVSRGPIDTGIPRETLDEIKARVPIEQEIELAVTLRRHGSTLKGCCPFHDDRNPSLVVWPDRGRFRCYPCNFGGDVFVWVQAYSHMTFREAVGYLAARAGVPLTQHRHGWRLPS